MGLSSCTVLKMKVIFILTLLFLFTGYGEGMFCPVPGSAWALGKYAFKRLDMASPEECNDLCNDDILCQYWKFRDGKKRVKRTCSLYAVLLRKKEQFVSGMKNISC